MTLNAENTLRQQCIDHRNSEPLEFDPEWCNAVDAEYQVTAGEVKRRLQKHKRSTIDDKIQDAKNADKEGNSGKLHSIVKSLQKKNQDSRRFIVFIQRWQMQS